MLRRLTLLLAVLATLAIAAGPAAASTAAADAKPVVAVEEIDFTDVHHEPDGTIVTSHQLGTRKITTFSDGTVATDEAYTLHQTLTRNDGVTVIYDSFATTEARSVVDGEVTKYFSLTSHTDISWNDGRDCDIDVRFLVVNDRVIHSDQVGPICTPG